MDEPKNPPEGQEPKDDFSYADLHKESVKDVAIETPKEEPVKETPKEEPKDEGEDLDVVGKKIADETAKRVLEEQKIAKDAEDAAKIPPKDEYEEWEKKQTEEKGRPPTYKEALEFVKEQAKKEIRAEQEEQVKAEEIKKTEATKAQEDERKRINTFVDDELQDLYNAGKLTKIIDSKNPSDQGVVERKALFAKWAEVNAERRAAGQPEIISATRIYEFYYKKPNAQPAGGDAPVAGSQSSGTPPAGEDEIDYKDIKKPWSFFKQKPPQG